MKLFTLVKNVLSKYMRLFTLWDFREDFSRSDKVMLSAVFAINVVNSFAKILAPATFAKAIEMLALSEETLEYGSLSLKPKELLYISAFFTAFIKSESYFKNILLSRVDNHVIEKNMMKVIEMEHAIPLAKHYLLRGEITQSFLEIINTQSRLSSEVASVIYQGLIDLILGSVLIWSFYGKIICSGFLLYCAFDFILLNNLVMSLTKQSIYFGKMSKVLNKLMNREFEILIYEETIRMFNHEELEKEITKHVLDKYISVKNNYHTSENVASLLKLLPYTLAMLMPVVLMIKEKNSLEDLDRFIFLVGYVNTFGSNVLNMNQSIKCCLRAIESVDKVKKLLANNFPEFAGNAYQLQARLLFQPNLYLESPEICFDNVHFTYPNAIHPTLKGVSFKLLPGKKLGIVGRSNAGKSTLVKLLYGFYKAQSGSIKINGVDIESIPAEVLSKLFCCVPQHAEFFKERSLKYNVLYGSPLNLFLKKYLMLEREKRIVHQPDAHAIEIQEDDNDHFLTIQKANEIFSNAMKKVELLSLVNKDASKKVNHLPLSGGQKQRLNIARALVRNSSIFIFDEATASLDSFTECEVLRNIKECTRKKSVMMITHRLSTIKDADEVVVIEEGEVVEKGSPMHLIESRGVFYNYWQTQMC